MIYDILEVVTWTAFGTSIDDNKLNSQYKNFSAYTFVKSMILRKVRISTRMSPHEYWIFLYYGFVAEGMSV